MTSLNPVLTVGRQITEGMRGASRRDAGGPARDRAVELLDLVGIPDPDRRLDAYPHQLSGGMRQRVMIAIALACEPDVLIADEPTTALDVTTQAQIVELVRERCSERTGMAVVWITHDLGVVAGVADHVAVMYGGRVVEQAPVETLRRAPAHPYTRGAAGGAPAPRRGDATSSPPSRAHRPTRVELPPGCVFFDRCPVRGIRGARRGAGAGRGRAPATSPARSAGEGQ